VAVVVVDHDAGPVLGACLASLVGAPVDDVVVVDNGCRLDPAPWVLEAVERGVPVRLVRTGRNLGYGAGANRGVAATDAEVVMVTNPDVELHRGAVQILVGAVVDDPAVAVVGPRIMEADGRRYPSARRFPSPLDALGHALLGRWRPANRYSARYRMDDLVPSGPLRVDWVSGACFAARREAWEELGGFDESYFMYAEDMDLCWRAGRAGWAVVHHPGAAVTHVHGVSTSAHPYAMVLAHHRSALRFAWRTSTGWRRLLVPGAAAVLGARVVTELARLSIGGARQTSSEHGDELARLAVAGVRHASPEHSD
jgi:N-acetylglucosaminyl-diphospho-decaprenol L-rhamnosyltransferase